MRDEITKKLEEWEANQEGLSKDQRIFYGQKPKTVVLQDWNYIVFGVEDINKSGTNSMDLNGYYFVDIIRENYIDDQTIFTLIQKIEEIPGMKLCKGTNPVDYIIKGKTDIVCELMRLRFTRPMKRCGLIANN